MQSQIKLILDIANIELAYARAEVALLERVGDEKTRIQSHLASLSDQLDMLLQLLGDDEHVDEIAKHE
jgi:hypothetical protein